MPLSVPAKSRSQYHTRLDEGFSSTQSIFQDLQLSQCKSDDQEQEKVLIIDVAQLAHEVQTSERFDELVKWFPMSSLLGDCYDYDTFYSLLLDITETGENPEDAIPAATIDKLDSQGIAFVEHYRNDFIQPKIQHLSNMGSVIVKAVTPNMQAFVLY